MNADALIGTVLGTCTLQRLVGQGGMGAVYLAQQSRPRRQVAVKVLLPMTPLSPHQLAAFLERFRRETDAAASLEHPHIMPVYEYGESAGTAFLVMPYISGGTLRDELEETGPLSLARAVNYLEQMAAALDFAHENGVIHRDIKPANIMVTPDGRLLLTDFGLVKIVDEGQSPQIRLTGAGAPVGTPDYMSPEQVIGENVDTRADLYSLGVILYQMVTGRTPFVGETPMQIAAQHLQVPPPSPQMLRRDLPIAAEQVILRAMAKRADDRYTHADDLAQAFRSAILSAGIELEDKYTRSGMMMTSPRLPMPNTPKGFGQFNKIRQTIALPKVTTLHGTSGGLLGRTGQFPVASRSTQPAADTMMTTTSSPPQAEHAGGLLSRTGQFPAMQKKTGTLSTMSDAMPPTGGLLSRTGKFSALQTTTDTMAETLQQTNGLLSRTGKFPLVGESTGTNVLAEPDTGTYRTDINISPAMSATPSQMLPSAPTNNYTGPLAGQAQDPGNPFSTMKLTGPVKVVKVPVAGQPGQYITGLLPVSKNSPSETGSKRTRSLPARIALLVVTLLVVLAGAFWFLHSSTAHVQQPVPVPAKLDPAMLARVHATATAQANVILSDPLTQNVHNWNVTPPDYAFKDGAYHIANSQNKSSASILSASSFPAKLSYQITMDEIKGNDTSSENSFGMIFRCNQQKRPGSNTLVTTFYSFEVVNAKGQNYQFWKYDDSNQQNPWTLITNGQLPVGNEFHLGQGTQNTNTIKIAMDGDKFTVTVNGTTLSKVFQDGSFPTGMVGMIVNMQGTEVAFSNLLLTHN